MRRSISPCTYVSVGSCLSSPRLVEAPVPYVKASTVVYASAMSEAERKKWDARYAAGAYAGRGHPSKLLADWVARIPRGRALDVACGRGRNALYLAQHGFEVDAIDISPVALERAALLPGASGVCWSNVDLDQPTPPIPAGPYDLIVLVRYVNLRIYPMLIEQLADHGVLLTEQHLQTTAEVTGPRNPDFRVAPGALRRLCRELQPLYEFEGLLTDPDQRPVALVQLVAQKRDVRFDRRTAEPA